MSTPLLSVVVICRNCCPLLAETLASIWMQQNPEWLETVVVDGASSDGTADYLARQTVLHPGLRWISEPDRGISDAHRKGVLLARGDYVLFLNSGDLLDNPHVCPDFLSALKRGRPDVLFGSARYFDGERDLDWRWPSFREIGPEWLNHFYPHHQASFFRRALFDDYPIDARFKMAGDHDVYARLVAAGRLFRYAGFDVVRFDVNGCGTDGMSFRRSFRQTGERLLIIWRHVGHRQALVRILPLTGYAFGRSLLRKLMGKERFLRFIRAC